jgi:hypothetical protein
MPNCAIGRLVFRLVNLVTFDLKWLKSTYVSCRYFCSHSRHTLKKVNSNLFRDVPFKIAGIAQAILATQGRQ